MIERDDDLVTGEIYEETTEITLVELCEVCSVERAMIVQMIDEGILDPIGGTRDEPRFPHRSVRRVRTVIHLRRDLGVNLAGAALALDLLECIENLQRRLRRDR